ncbi:MAG: AAA family ATPase, partial [Streptosporangiaceae bacterium]
MSPADEEIDRGAVTARKNMLRVDRLAQAELAAEGMAVPPPVATGTDFLAEPDADAAYRIDQVWPAGGNILCAAQAKAGKTTVVTNLLRSLCDGDPLFGRFRVDPPEGSVFLIDVEMPRDQARGWIRAQGIRKTDRFTYQPLRGAASSFNITVPAIRRKWAARIADAGAGVIILDPLGPVLAAIGLDENSGADVGSFLDGALGELLAESGASEAVVIHHMGHAAERSRGTSRLRGWPDAEWLLVRQDDEPGSERYFKAYGRDVDVAERRLDYDPVTRALTIAGGSRRQAKSAAALADLVRVVTAQPGINARAIEEALRTRHGHTLH